MFISSQAVPNMETVYDAKALEILVSKLKFEITVLEIPIYFFEILSFETIVFPHLNQMKIIVKKAL